MPLPETRCDNDGGADDGTRTFDAEVCCITDDNDCDGFDDDDDDDGVEDDKDEEDEVGEEFAGEDADDNGGGGGGGGRSDDGDDADCNIGTDGMDNLILAAAKRSIGDDEDDDEEEDEEEDDDDVVVVVEAAFTCGRPEISAVELFDGGRNCSMYAWSSAELQVLGEICLLENALFIDSPPIVPCGVSAPIPPPLHVTPVPGASCPVK